MAIVRAGGRSTAMTEGSRKFCSVLETINAAGKVSYQLYHSNSRIITNYQ